MDPRAATLLALSALTLGAGMSRQPARAPGTPRASPETLQAEIAGLKPARHAWREIAWKNCPLEALQESRERDRPVLAWVFLGNPADERC